MRLEDRTDIGGGANGQMFWYVQVTSGDITNYDTPFYGAGAVNFGAATTLPQYVPLKLLGTTLVNFIGFNAVKNNNNALLSWSVSNETSNTSHYEVERSLDGIHFTSIKTVQPKNNGSSTNTYDLTDLNLKSIRNSGNIYYRVKQYDMDGKFKTTNIRNVTVEGAPMSIFPNPVKNTTNLNYELEATADVNIMILDAAGKQVKQMQAKGIKGSNVETIDMSALANGTYMIKVQIGNDINTISVVKSK
jgi:hypothetical protein